MPPPACWMPYRRVASELRFVRHGGDGVIVTRRPDIHDRRKRAAGWRMLLCATCALNLSVNARRRLPFPGVLSWHLEDADSAQAPGLETGGATGRFVNRPYGVAVTGRYGGRLVNRADQARVTVSRGTQAGCQPCRLTACRTSVVRSKEELISVGQLRLFLRATRPAARAQSETASVPSPAVVATGSKEASITFSV